MIQIEFKGTTEPIAVSRIGGQNDSQYIFEVTDSCSCGEHSSKREIGRFITTKGKNLTDMANAKAFSMAPHLLEALIHCLNIMEHLDVRSEMYEEYGNAVMNYTHLVELATDL
ncbi:MAG: hypothetical protein RSE50_00795 [Myroides sp.]